MKLTPNQSEYLNSKHPQHSLEPVGGGHMAYTRGLVTTDGAAVGFIKAHHPEHHQHAHRELQAVADLQKEATVYNLLAEQDYLHLPANVDYAHNMLHLSPLAAADDWQWQAPCSTTDQHNYITQVLGALDRLQMPASTVNDSIPDSNTHNYFTQQGWQKIKRQKLGSLIVSTAHEYKPNLHPWAAKLVPLLAEFILQYEGYAAPQQDMQLQHHDARQPNIAWHPEHGVKIVDWAWAGMGLPDADKTMFLADLHKSGINVSDYMGDYNPDHALTMAGYWLAKSTEPAYENKSNVRFHQLASALSAMDLLK